MSAARGARASPRRAPTWSQEPTIQIGRRSGAPVQFVLQAPSIDALERSLPRFMDEASQDPAVLVRRRRSQVHQPRAAGLARSRAGARPRRRRARRRRDAAARTLRAAPRLLPARRPAVRDHQPGRAREPQRHRRPAQPVRAVAERRAGAARQAGDGERGEPAAAALPLRPLRLRHRVGGARAGLHAGRRHRRDARRSPSARSTTRSRPRSPASRATSSSRRTPAVRVPARAGAGVPGAGGAVRELPRSAGDHAHGAARARRRAGRALVLRPDAQPVQPDRHDHADRPGDQERHPDRRVRQPAARGGPSRSARR